MGKRSANRRLNFHSQFSLTKTIVETRHFWLAWMKPNSSTNCIATILSEARMTSSGFVLQASKDGWSSQQMTASVAALSKSVEYYAGKFASLCSRITTRSAQRWLSV